MAHFFLHFRWMIAGVADFGFDQLAEAFAQAMDRHLDRAAVEAKPGGGVSLSAAHPAQKGSQHIELFTGMGAPQPGQVLVSVFIPAIY